MDGLSFVVTDRAGAFRRQIGAHSGAHATLPRNGIHTAEFTLDDDDAALPALAETGARVHVLFRDRERFRGKVSEFTGDGPDGTVTVKMLGDVRKLWEWQGWPAPGLPIGTQPETRTYSGRSEQVFKDALAENFTRLGVPWSVAPDNGLGTGGQRVEFRFHPLADKLVPLLELDGLAVTLAYDAAGHVTVDVVAPTPVTGTLTAASGMIDRYTYSLIAPTGTRAGVGGAGEGAARQIIQVTDTARETDWGDIVEMWVDSRMADAGADLTPDGLQALADAAPRVGVDATLLEGPLLTYGETYDELSAVHVQIGPVDEVLPITQVTIDDTPTDGVIVTPMIGAVDIDAPSDVLLARQIARLAAGARDQGRR